MVGKRTDSAFLLVGGTKRSDCSETDQSGRGVLSSCQADRPDWPGKRSVPIDRGTEHSDWLGIDKFLTVVKQSVPIDAEFFGAIKRGLSIGQGNEAF